MRTDQGSLSIPFSCGTTLAESGACATTCPSGSRVAQASEGTTTMKAHVLDRKDHDRITAGLPFVEALARRMADRR